MTLFITFQAPLGIKSSASQTLLHSRRLTGNRFGSLLRMFLTTLPRCIPHCLDGLWFHLNLHISQGKHILPCSQFQHTPDATGLRQMRTSSHTCQGFFMSQRWLARERTQCNTYFISQLTILMLLHQISDWIHICQWVI